MFRVFIFYASIFNSAKVKLRSLVESRNYLLIIYRKECPEVSLLTQSYFSLWEIRTGMSKSRKIRGERNFQKMKICKRSKPKWTREHGIYKEERGDKHENPLIFLEAGASARSNFIIFKHYVIKRKDIQLFHTPTWCTLYV